MVSLQYEKDHLTLLAEGEILLEHTIKKPFAVAVKREKTYAFNRGSVKESVSEAVRQPLVKVEQENDRIVFSGGGRRLEARLRSFENGAELELSGEEGWSYEFALPAYDGEAVFGGGEQYRKTNLRGEHVVNFVSEHIKASTIIQKAVLPKALYVPKKHGSIGSYAPMPVFVTDRCRLIYFDVDSDGISKFGDEKYDFIFDRCPVRLTLLKGRSYEELSRSMAERIVNRQYIPEWCHSGMILGVQGGTETVLKKAFDMLDAGAAVSAVWCQDWSGENRTVMGKQVWWNWEADEKLYPGLKEAIARLNSRGVKFLGYINPYLVKDSSLYDLCRDRNWLITKKSGEVYHIKSTTFDAGMLDLTNPETVRFIKEELIKKNMMDLGITGWMADFGEYLPIDCVLHDGDPARLHNLWPVMWARINREAIEEFGSEENMFFTRSGYLGIQTYAPILWNGDQHTDFTKDYGMPCVMPASFSLGFSGVTMVHCDIGGFFSFGKMRRNAEVFTRWMEMCAFSLLMRSHESIRPWANVQFDHEKVLPHTRRLTNIHRELRPYIEHCAGLAASGVPAVRPDFWDEVSYTASRDMYSYFLGEDMFVCPVFTRGSRHRSVHLPKGKWVYFWSGEEYDGGNEYRIPSPLGKIPVFYRKDSRFSQLFRGVADKYTF
ncbi:MAG: alpha-glucosidase [Clostridia bacterium]|nr:alpha-glucosidase [Clostridia bacterium]